VAVGRDGSCYLHGGDRIYRVDRDGQLTTFATIPTNSDSRILIDSADNIYVGGQEYLYAFNRYGSLKWKLPIALDVFYLAMGADGTIYVAGEDSEFEVRLYAVSQAPSGRR